MYYQLNNRYFTLLLCVTIFTVSLKFCCTLTTHYLHRLVKKLPLYNFLFCLYVTHSHLLIHHLICIVFYTNYFLIYLQQNYFLKNIIMFSNLNTLSRQTFLIYGVFLTIHTALFNILILLQMICCNLLINNMKIIKYMNNMASISDSR